MQRRYRDDSGADYEELLRRLALLGDDPDEAFSQLRARIVRIADQWGSRAPEYLADETLFRVARKLGQGVDVRDLPKYVIGIGRNVFHEMLRSQGRGLQFVGNFDALEDLSTDADRDTGSEVVDRLTECMTRLPAKDREMMLAYYDDDGDNKVDHRRRLARTFGLSRNALTVRMFRLRKWVERCLNEQSEQSSN